MRKYIILGTMLLGSIFSYADTSIKDVETELIQIGISEESITQAQRLLDEALKKHKIMLIERDQRELEINKLLIEDPEKNWFQINNLFDEIGQLEANLKKNQLKTQIDVRKFISKEDYIKAKELYIIRENLAKQQPEAKVGDKN